MFLYKHHECLSRLRALREMSREMVSNMLICKRAQMYLRTLCFFLARSMQAALRNVCAQPTRCLRPSPNDLKPPCWKLLVQCRRELLRRRLARELAPALPDKRIAARPDHTDLPVVAPAEPARLDPQMVIHDCSSAWPRLSNLYICTYTSVCVHTYNMYMHMCA